jgi:colanic acid biosynthesis glycosyl transferase WcaI
MTNQGHAVHVIAAHPHYPSPEWGKKLLPYVEHIDGIRVTRLPLVIGRDTTGQRMIQEASFALAQLAALPFLGKCDVCVAVSPCFPAVSAGIVNKRVRRVPWVLWIQDILPDGAVSTGIMEDGIAIKASRRLESAAYKSADRVVVISERFEENLLAKGVPDDKLVRIYNPATRPIRDSPRGPVGSRAPRVLVMGNIGHSQGLPEVVEAFESSAALSEIDARLVITGTGVAAEEVRETIKTDRVEYLGLVTNEELDAQLELATIGLVSQQPAFQVDELFRAGTSGACKRR